MKKKFMDVAFNYCCINYTLYMASVIKRPATASERVVEWAAKGMFWSEFGRWPTVIIHTAY